MTKLESRADERLWSTLRLKLVVSRRGVELPGFEDGEPLLLGVPELLLVERLVGSGDDAVAAVAAGTGVDGERLGVVLDYLCAHDLVAAEAPIVVGGSDVGAPDMAEGPGLPVGVDTVVVLPTPMVFSVDAGQFVWADFEGMVRLRVSAVELLALAGAWRPVSAAGAAAVDDDEPALSPLDETQLTDLFGRAVGCGLVRLADDDDPLNKTDGLMMARLRASMARRHRVLAAIDASVEAFEQDDVGADLVTVAPVNTSHQVLPAALGMCFAYARVHDGGALGGHYRFHPRWVVDHQQVRDMAPDVNIFVFSNYNWDTEEHLEFSATVKEANPDCITIHGGPDTPKYEQDSRRFFRAHPHVDITVHGEGEITFAEILTAMGGQFEGGPPDLSPLAEVAGLSYRAGDRVVRTAARERIADLDMLPSPYLTGIFDDLVAAPDASVIMETNRGCPYGCTFCDWGSATRSRIRKFDLDRVYAELEWCGRHEVRDFAVADANFGIFERDVDIASRIAEVRRECGSPKTIIPSFAKNRVKYRRRIIETLADAGILTEGIVSLQSMDDNTLAAINRSNIKTEAYDDLAVEFQKAGLPLAVELMMGLPGSTVDSFKNDLQQCIDRDLRARIYLTRLLTNSPMNAPDYREEHGIVALPGQLVEQAASYSTDDYDHMTRLRQVVYLCDNFGVLRQVATYVRSETGVREIDLYERLVRATWADHRRWPLMSFVFEAVPGLMAPPGSWRPFLDEVRRYLIEEEGVADDDALVSVLDVQHALLPAFDRTFPHTIELTHDYAAWHHQARDARQAGHLHDWEKVVPALRCLGPARFVTEDPNEVCLTAIGGTPEQLILRAVSWEFRSPVSRARGRTRVADS